MRNRGWKRVSGNCGVNELRLGSGSLRPRSSDSIPIRDLLSKPQKPEISGKKRKKRRKEKTNEKFLDSKAREK